MISPISSMVKGDLMVETYIVGSYCVNTSIIYSIKTKEAIVIDPGLDATVVLAAVSSKNLCVKKIIHTHAHFDHTTASGLVAKETGAALMLHEDDLTIYEMLEKHAMMFNTMVSLKMPIDLMLKEGDTISLGNDFPSLLRVIHTPGHSPGGICFFTTHFDYPVLFAGDTLFAGSIGRTDLPGGNHSQLINSIKQKLFQLPANTLIIPGHGEFSTIGKEKATNPFLT